MAYGLIRSITIDHTKAGAGDSTNFPVLISGVYAYLATIANGGDVHNANGYDIAFYADQALTTPLFWEIEQYDAATGTVVFWVQVPTVSHTTDTVFYMAYSDATISTFQSTASSVWDSDFRAVYHIGGDTAQILIDSTSNGNNLSNTLGHVTPTAAKIDGGGLFASGRPGFEHADTASLQLLTGWHVEGWFKPATVTTSYQCVASKTSDFGASGSINYSLFVTPTGLVWAFYNGGIAQSAAMLSGGTMYHLVGNWDGTTIRVYINGAPDGVLTSSTTPSNVADKLRLGDDGTLFGDPIRDGGILDEVRISAIARSADWILTGYNNQNDPATFYTISAPIVSDQTVTMDAVVMGPRAIPSPVVSHVGAPQTITMGGPVRGPRNILTPIIAGPITMGGPVLGPRFIPTPAVHHNQVITLASPVVGPRAIPSPRVAFIQLITMASPVVGPRAIPTPTVRGGPQYMSVLSPVRGPRRIPIPTVNGGVPDCRIFIAGVDATQYFSWVDNEVRIESQTIGRWKATFSLRVHTGIGTYRPRVGMTVLIIDLGRRLFMGCISAVLTSRYMSTVKEMVYVCTANDKASIFDHRVVTGKVYGSLDDAMFVVRDICENYLVGEGIDLSDLPAVGTFGELGADLPLNFVTVTNAFDSISKLIGCIYWVDVFGRLQWSSLSELPPCPVSFTETSKNWRNLTVNEDTGTYYNKFYAVSNLNIMPGSGAGGQGSTGAGAGVSESFTWTPDGPGIRTITDGTGARVAVGIETSTAIGTVPSLKVDGVVQTVVDFGLYAGQVASPPDLLWFFAGPATGSPSAFASPTVLPTAGQTIVIVYTPAVTTSSSIAQYGTALNPLNPFGDPLGTCGSGTFEGVIQVKDIADQAGLNAVAAAELARQGSTEEQPVPLVVNLETDEPGIQPGQEASILIPLSGINSASMLVTTLSGVFIAPAGALGRGGSFRWQMEARTNLDPGNWAKFYERLVLRTANPLPVLQADPLTFVSGGTGLAAGTPFGNPYIVHRTCRVVALTIAAALPPVDQDLIVTFTSSRGTFLGVITLPRTAIANEVVVVQVAPGVNIYLFALDTVTAAVLYSVVGTGTPVKASGVTAKVFTTV